MSAKIDHRSIMSRRREEGAAIVVTGAAGGIGGGIVERLLADGWQVIATDLSAEALERLKDGAAGAALSFAPLDVADSAAVRALAVDLDARGVAVAGLVNAAGLLQDIMPFMTMDEAAHRKIWDVNYFGALACTREFGACIMAGGGGSIVNITSINEIRPLPLHAYAPTKVALGSMTALTAGEFGQAGLRVNAVAPGFTLTPIMRAKIESGTRDDSAIKQATAMGRLVEIEEIAAVVGFLMSDAASAVSGASIPVDAGWLATSHWMNFGAALR
ncbi:NAD(P)-dependent dehydrogenase, short-chain alcohol dehydrogenase family [Bosea thiooxidans]|uniref:NAD(P)-dependent dehydrogenase, short-chain alcohol dehydrogenase family n=2 Tax=Bosea thiooxidans TaxID=53254 RepID=A0A1T5DAN4_9HYPH|nr:SDR family oxidoreductase [Bosea thiooxidans]SKB68647.1 NAD(P)-dependent dehydrogenase, short-chain alcohol dehydrogenase family [Bosea thiooxidans]